MTLKEVAKAAHVSVSTASKAITGSKDVSEKTRCMVLDTARKLGYFADKKRVKQGNKSKKRFTVAIICPEVISIHYAEKVTEFTDCIEKMGGECRIYICGFNKERRLAVIEECDKDDRIDGIICLSGDEVTNTTPIIYLDVLAYQIIRNISRGIRKAVEHLQELGHKKIGFAGEQNTYGREASFLDAVEDRSYVFRSDARFEECGRLAAEHYIRNSMPTAVICAYDEIAFGLIKRFSEAGIRVPEDVSVVGINDIRSAPYCCGGLTTLRASFNREPMELLEELKKAIDKSRHVAIPFRFESELIVRNTTAQAK